MGTALANHSGTLHVYPSATLSLGDLPPQQRWSWLVAIIPYVDQNRFTCTIDFDKPWDAEESRRTVLFPCSLYYCPANPDQRAPTRESLSHYVGIAGLNDYAASLSLDDGRAGFFGYDRPRPPRKEISFGICVKDIKDGKSTTLVAAETTLANGPWVAGGPATVRGLDPAGPPYLGAESQFGSHHRGGSNALFADGSVRFLPDSIDPRLFEAMATIAGGEDVPPVGDAW
jgi:prepilin-type processing-associated H-X9-DG protein